MVVMISVFFKLINGLDDAYNFKSVLVILSENYNISLAIKKIILAVYLLSVLCIPIFLTDSTGLSIFYCTVILIGTIIGKYTFWGYLIIALSLPGMLLGAVADAISWIIRLLFSGFNGAWLVCIFQIIGHFIMIQFLKNPSEFIKEMKEDDSACRTTSAGNSETGTIAGIMMGFMDDMEKIDREKREKQTLETLQEIERDLRRK